MTKLPLLVLAALSLAACQEEVSVLPDPVDMTADAVGHYCQMDILEHLGPKAQIHLAGLTAPLFFSQVRDAIAYQRMPEQQYEIVAIYVSDMGDPDATWDIPGISNWISADDAHYVRGGDIVGGMGVPELVPFSSQDNAQAFALQHGGEVISLADVSDTDVLSPVGANAPVHESEDEDSDFTMRLNALTQGVGG
ncbi:MAG: nitrous oxide reductase accessory protein NosL [Devosiaceae bacterium]